MPTAESDRFYVAGSVADAVAALVDRGPAGAPLAGATWIMRSPLRGERALDYVCVSGIDALRHVIVSEREVFIGACVTHSELAAALHGIGDCRVLAEAAAQSANPAIREVATVGGNLCATGFAAADLVPAMLCLDAEAEFHTVDGPERIPMAQFLGLRAGLPPGWLLARVIVPRALRRSVHVRLPLRKAGDYPVAIVSMALTLDAAGLIQTARVAVGSVEEASRRWTRLESGLVGGSPDARDAWDKARAFLDDFRGRDGVEAPGWYRRNVLPVLVQRAVRAIQA